MTRLIFIYMLFAILTAFIMEWLKKWRYGHYETGGIWKTSLSVGSIRGAAFVLSVAHAVLICIADDYTGLGWYLLPAWVGLCYFGQYVIDMTFVKKLAGAIIERVRGRR